MKKGIAIFTIIFTCLFVMVNTNETKVCADFDDVTYEDFDSSNPND